MKKLFLIFSAVALLALNSCVGGNGDNKEKKVDTVVANAVDNVEASGVFADGDGYKVKDNAFFPESLPMVVDFSATWCPPCQTYKPIFEAVKAKYKDRVIFLSVDVDEYPKIANTYKVQSIPCTVFILPGGGEMGREIGSIPQNELEAYINQLIAQVAGEDLSI